MGMVRHYISAFLAGEISPMLLGRVDSQQHEFGLQTCENWVPTPEGPIMKRPGFIYIRDADPTATWLTAFRFNLTQEYTLEWGANKLRFFTNGGRIETAPNVAYEVATPYAAADAPFVSCQQSYDRLYMDHGSYPPGAISRSSAITFSYAVSAFTDGPFANQNTDKTILVSTSGPSGAITLTATAPIWTAAHVGALFELAAFDFSTVSVWEPGMANVAVGRLCRSDGKIYYAQTSGTTGSAPPIHNQGTEYDGMGLSTLASPTGPYGVKWLYLSERMGTATITAFISATQVSATVIKQMPDSLHLVPSWRWSQAAFSNAAGWPSLVIHWVGRQIHFKGFNILASVAGDYLNHSAFTSSGLPTADLAFQRTLATEDPPLWAMADRSMLVGTASKELAIMPINTAAALSGSNIQSINQSFYGSEYVFPIQAATSTVFIERGGRRVRTADYVFARDRYDAIDITAAARHITASTIIQLAYQRAPYALLHGVRGDGQLVTHPVTRNDLKGFCRTVLGGGATILSAVSIVGVDGKTDELWLLVTRASPSGPRREIWKQAPWRELGDNQRAAFFVDGGATAAAIANQTHFSGLTQLAGQAVVVLADGGVIPGLTVAMDGTLDLPAGQVPGWAYIMTVGLPYTATAVTLRPQPAAAKGMIQGLRQRVIKLVLRLLDTAGISAGAPGLAMEDLLDRPANWPMDAPVPLFTGDTDGAAVECDFDSLGQMTFISSLPLPGIVGAAMFKLDVDEADV